jgi:hypothetical protein
MQDEHCERIAEDHSGDNQDDAAADEQPSRAHLINPISLYPPLHRGY